MDLLNRIVIITDYGYRPQPIEQGLDVPKLQDREEDGLEKEEGLPNA